MSKKWTKAKIVGHTVNPFRPGPAIVFKDVDEPDEMNVSIAIPAEPGVPIPLGAEIVDFRRKGATEDDVEYRSTSGRSTSKGPIQVSTQKFRSGWEKTFGKNGVN